VTHLVLQWKIKPRLRNTMGMLRSVGVYIIPLLAMNPFFIFQYSVSFHNTVGVVLSCYSFYFIL
jgi:hypothetical protein